MKYVLMYESDLSVMPLAREHFTAHSARLHEFHDRGELLMVGPFMNEDAANAMAVFTTREAAEAFVKVDPFVQNGVVQQWRIREWNETFAP